MRISLSFTVFLFFIPVLFYGCERRLTWQKSINKNYGQIIDFDWNKQFVLKDTILRKDNYLNAPIKIVSSIEDGVCDSCLLNYLTGASIFMEELHSDSVVFLAISKNRTEEQLLSIMKNIDSKRCVMIQDLDGKYCGNEELKKKK